MSASEFRRGAVTVAKTPLLPVASSPNVCHIPEPVSPPASVVPTAVPPSYRGSVDGG